MNGKILVTLAALTGSGIVSSPAQAQSIFPVQLMNFFQSAPTPAPTPTVMASLSSRRSVIALPSFSTDQKQRIADQALYFIKNFYVHQYLKKEAFGVDAVAELTAIQQEAKGLSDADLHGKIQSVFSRLRDLHTNYIYPKPLQCYTSILPFVLEEAVDASGAEVMAVSGLIKSPEFAALAPDVNKLTHGDTLISFSGVDPQVAIQAYFEVGAGANPSALKRRAMESLTERGHGSSFLPTRDVEHLQFKKTDGSVYDVDFPWISIADNDCLHPAPVPAHKMGQPEPKVDKRNFLQAVNPEQVKFNQIFKEARVNNVFGAAIDTAEDSIHYQVLKSNLGDFGLLRLDSFDPKSAPAALKIVNDLLGKELAGTNGLIIDLRGNGGGSLTYGELMLQFFTPKAIDTDGFTMLASKENSSFLKATDLDPDYLKLVEEAIQAGKPLTAAAKLTPVADANALGQVYTKPVIVLVDSACFSTCDMFSAGMQDNGIATLISTDGSTGGGGANVITYSDFEKVFAQTAPHALNPLQELPGGQDMRVAWRESERVGVNAGKLIENTGVIADQTIKIQLQDLIAKDSVLFSNLIRKLSAQYEASTKSQVVLNTEGRTDFTEGSPLTVSTKVAGTSSVEVRASGKVLATLPIDAASATLSPILLTIPASVLSGLTDLSNVNLVGTLNNGSSTSDVWRKVMSLRRLPVARVSAPVNVNMASGNLSPLKLYTDGPAGWNAVNGTMRVGSSGANYPNDTHAEASLFMNVPTGPALALKFASEVHSEKDFDFFRVSIFSDGKEIPVIAPISGDVSKATSLTNLGIYAGKSIEIRFTFDSDAGVNGIGPVISGLSIQTAQGAAPAPVRPPHSRGH